MDTVTEKVARSARALIDSLTADAPAKKQGGRNADSTRESAAAI